MALLTALLVSASPAAAETDCVSGENGDLIVRVNEKAGVDTVLHMNNEVLYVNGDPSCGSPNPPPGNQAVVTIVDVVGGGESHVEDTIVIDLTKGDWRHDNEAVFVNLVLSGVAGGGTDKVVIRATSGPERVLTQGDFILVNRPDLYPAAGADHRYFFMQTQASISNQTNHAEYKFLLAGGKDRFNMTPDPETGGWFGQKVVVKGGSGNDVLKGGPLKQWLYGGKGADEIDGAGGNDRLKGQAGNDRIKGNNGNDTIIGGTGKDRTWGGKGNDTFKMNDGRKDYKVKGGAGNDTCKCDKKDPVGSTARR